MSQVIKHLGGNTFSISLPFLLEKYSAQNELLFTCTFIEKMIEGEPGHFGVDSKFFSYFNDTFCSCTVDNFNYYLSRMMGWDVRIMPFLCMEEQFKKQLSTFLGFDVMEKWNCGEDEWRPLAHKTRVTLFTKLIENGHTEMKFDLQIGE